MILVDTSVWISHLRHGHAKMAKLLNESKVVCHPFIIGELACGNIKNRKAVLSLLHMLPSVETIGQGEMFSFIENHRLMGKGLGLIDVHLLASTLLNGVWLWTLDTRLKHQASALGIAYKTA